MTEEKKTQELSENGQNNMENTCVSKSGADMANAQEKEKTVETVQ